MMKSGRSPRTDASEGFLAAGNGLDAEAIDFEKSLKILSNARFIVNN